MATTDPGVIPWHVRDTSGVCAPDADLDDEDVFGQGGDLDQGEQTD